MRVHAGWCALSLLGFCLLPTSALAQTGSVAGQVRSLETAAPLPDASVEIRSQGGQVMSGSRTDEAGRFRILNVAAGEHAIEVRLFGFGHRALTIRVVGGETTDITVDLEPRPTALETTVIVASQVRERALDAPASVHSVDQRTIEERPVVTTLDHLEAVPGVDIAKIGIGSGTAVTRGFNNIFSGSLFMLTDHRIAGVPSLRVNLMHMIPSTNEDMERMEVVLGPGSALYGPNTANGVLHVFTRSPLTSSGTVLSVTRGERNLLNGSARTSHLLTENLGVKLSGEYMRADEWEHTDPGEIRLRDFRIERWSGEARADWRVTSDFTSVFSVGRSQLNNGVELTGIGAAQVRDWAYTYYQARGTWGRLFGQVYLNTSDAGDTFLLRSGEPIIDRSQLLVAQLQHGTTLGERQRFTYGVDFLHTRPNTEGTIHGRYEDDDDVREIGAYLQSQTAVTERIDFVAAARIDDHNRLERPVFSPRLALVLKPTIDQAVRLTYNRAFSTPRSLDFFLDLDAGLFPDPRLANFFGLPGYGLRAQGGGGTGFAFQRTDGGYLMRSPFAGFAAQAMSPGLAQEASVPIMWDIAVGVLHAQGAFGAPGSPQADGTAAFLRGLSPTDNDIGRIAWDVLSGQMQPLQTANIDDVPVLLPTFTTTFEVGYKGILGNRLLLAADVWSSTRNNFVSALRPVTPLLLLEGQSIAQFLVSRGMSPQQAGAIAAGMAQLPLGVITADNVSSAQNRADFLVTYRNFGRISLWGSDVSATLLLGDHWTVGATASYASQDVFETEGELLTLNAPATKFSTSLGYRASGGFHGELRLRHSAAFPVLSAPYIATQCIPESSLPEDWERSPFEEPCVKSATLADLSLGYRIPRMRSTAVQLMVQNVFNDGYRSFPGSPEVGRMAMVRMRYEFQ